MPTQLEGGLPKYVMMHDNLFLFLYSHTTVYVMCEVKCLKSKNYISFSNHGDDAECVIPGVGVVVGAGSIHCAVH